MSCAYYFYNFQSNLIFQVNKIFNNFSYTLIEINLFTFFYLLDKIFLPS